MTDWILDEFEFNNSVKTSRSVYLIAIFLDRCSPPNDLRVKKTRMLYVPEKPGVDRTRDRPPDHQ